MQLDKFKLLKLLIKKWRMLDWVRDPKRWSRILFSLGLIITCMFPSLWVIMRLRLWIMIRGPRSPGCSCHPFIPGIRCLFRLVMLLKMDKQLRFKISLDLEVETFQLLKEVLKMLLQCFKICIMLTQLELLWCRKIKWHGKISKRKWLESSWLNTVGDTSPEKKMIKMNCILRTLKMDKLANINLTREAQYPEVIIRH